MSGVHPSKTFTSSLNMAGLAEEEMTAAQAEMKSTGDKWNSIRLLSDEEAEAQLSGDELEEFKTYHKRVHDDNVEIQELAKMIMKGVEPPKVQPKTKGQRKRDKWAKVQAIAAAKAAAKN